MTYNEMMIDDLLHKIEIQNQKIGDMDKEIERLHKVFDIKDEERCKIVKENKELQRIINDLQSELAEATNDYKQASNEIKLLDNQIDNLITENNQLKLRNKMLTKIGFNSIYGINCYKNYCVNSIYGSHCYKNHCVYTDTDSIKTGGCDKE